ncbi:MAG: hypothetical protein DYH14_04760 [Betaproteobacteria bacterium PRO3]|nr:hypothetical protein [Betaproteobacteria bacterium PRO3]
MDPLLPFVAATVAAWLLEKIQTHMVQRGWGGHDTTGGKALYIGGLTIASTLLGALAMEVNDMLSGKDPRPLYGADGKFVARNWMAAFFKDGSVGIYGDFLANEVAPGASTPLATLLGPTGRLLEDAGRVTLGNATEYAAGKSLRETNAGVELVRMEKCVIPSANLWYAKAAPDHINFNQAMNAMNPDYLRRVRDRAQREFGSGYWWAPQSPEPTRAPNLGAAIGGKQP